MPKSPGSNPVSFLGVARFGPGFDFAAEPQAVREGPFKILFRGYIANAHEIGGRRADEERIGNSAMSGLFAAAFRRWGAELPIHVHGEFAVAIIEPERARITLAHDELGLTNLYYCLQADRISFGSHLEDLIEEVGAGSIDEEYIADFFALREHFGYRTPYRDIHRLRAGEALVWERGSVRIVKTWSLGSVTPARGASAQAREEEFRALVTEAVRSSLPDSGRVLCELSGGLDSSTVYTVASTLGAGPEAMSWVFPKSGSADERGYIGAVLRRHTGMWTALDADSARPFTELPERNYADPSPWLVSCGWDRLYRNLLDERRLEVVLSGEGGDAVFLGDQHEPFYLADLLRAGSWARLWKEAARWRRTANTRRSLGYMLTVNAVYPGLRHARGLTLEHRIVPIPWAAPDYSKRYRLAERGVLWTAATARSVADAQVLQRVARSAQVIANCNRHRKIASEFRHPLLYVPLLKFMLSLPWDVKMAPDKDRLLQRRALAEVLPCETLSRSDKGGGDQPFYEGLEQGRGWLTLLTERSRLVERGYVDSRRWMAALQQAMLGRTVGLKYLQASAALEVWFQQLGNKQSSGSRKVAQQMNTW